MTAAAWRPAAVAAAPAFLQNVIQEDRKQTEKTFFRFSAVELFENVCVIFFLLFNHKFPLKHIEVCGFKVSKKTQKKIQ